MAKIASAPSDCLTAQRIERYYKNFEFASAANLKHIHTFKADEMKDKNFNIKTLSPSYPAIWFCPIPSSPFANSMEEETMGWLKKLGLIPNKQVEENIRKMEPHNFAGYTLPLGNYEYAIAYCKFITLCLLFDDVEAEFASDPESIMPPFDALAGQPVTTVQSLNPYMVGFKEIGDEYERLGASRPLRERFADGMKEWARFAVQEADIRRSNQNRTLEEVLKIRSVTTGIQPTTVILERTVGFELPDEILKDPLYEKCIGLAALVCSLVNDLVGVGKDLFQNQLKTNVVLFHFLSMDESLEHSYQAIIDIHDKAVDDFDLCTAQLLQRVDCAWQERLHWFFMALRYMDTGYATWHQDCVRYSQYMVTEDDHVFKIRINSR